MKRLVLALLLAAAAAEASFDDRLDRLGEALTWVGADGHLRARVRGLLDLEMFSAREERAELRFPEGERLFAPRLSTFLDAQAGERVYLFAQARLDTGFDPTEDALRVRLDELAVRFTVLERDRLNLQVGKFATIVGAWSARHRSWENPFVNAPLPFELVTAIWDDGPSRTAAQLLRRAHVEPLSDDAGVAGDKRRRLPMIWGPAYASGAMIAGRLGRWDYALEAKNAALSARPSSWDLDDRPWGGPAWGGRVGFRPDERWNLGVSLARGVYLTRAGSEAVVSGSEAHDHRQTHLGLDLAFAHRRLQVWSEFHASRFAAPGVGDVTTRGWYLETKYKFSPLVAGAVRWNAQEFSSIVTTDGRRVGWGREVRRLDLVLIRRLSTHAQVKLQYSPQRETPAPRRSTDAFAAQLTVRF